MPDTKIISITEAMEITQEIPEILQRLQMLFDADVEFVELGVDGDQIIVKPVEKHSPSASASHVPSVNWDNDQLLVSKAIDEEKRYTLAPWYIPDSLDAHDEWADKDEIQRAFWNYLKNPDRTIKLQHNHDIVAGEWVEGLTWPHEVEVQVKHPDGDRTIKFPAGTPFLGVIWEPWAWQLIKDGEIRGLSIGGKGKRMEADLEDYSYENTGGASFTKTQTDYLQETESVVPAATLSIIKTFIDSIIKHGNHDQTTHGRGGKKQILYNDRNAPLVADEVADIPPRSQKAVDVAESLRGSAEKLEPEITKNLMALSEEYNGNLVSLEYRLKTTDSLARKIDTKAMKENISIEQAAGSISDSIRYTLAVSNAEYTIATESLVQEFQNDGFEVNAKNYWETGDSYQGMNIQLSKGGVKTELQLHTKSSYKIKTEKLHPIYEKARLTPRGSKLRKTYWNEMVSISSTIPLPSNIEGLLLIGTLFTQQASDL